MYSRHELAAGFHGLGIAPGDTVMAHASVRAVGDVAGGPDQIQLALKDALTADGTLMMYASCPAHYDEIGRGNLTAEQERELLEKLPAFDPLTARPSATTARWSSCCARIPGSMVNNHVARFVGVGQAGAVSALEAAVELRLRPRLGPRSVRRARRQDPAARLRSRHRDLPSLRRAHRRHPRQARVEVQGAGRRRRHSACGGTWRSSIPASGRIRNWPDRFFARLVDTYLAETGNRRRASRRRAVFPARRARVADISLCL